MLGFFVVAVRSAGNVVLKGRILMKARKVMFAHEGVHESCSLQHSFLFIQYLNVKGIL